MALTERAPRPADSVDNFYQNQVQVDVELVKQEKSFKNWKKAKNYGTPMTPAILQ
jgi:uridine phosphorylase